MAFKIKDSLRIGSTDVLNATGTTLTLLEAASPNAYTISITSGDLTQNRSLTLPDASGTIALLSDIPTDVNTTYAVSAVAGDDAYSEKIRLSGSDSSTDDVVLAVGAVGSTYGLTIEQSGDVITFKHADTSSQATVANTDRTYIQSITLDEFGHITAINSATETVVDTNTTYSVAAASTTGGANITLSGSDESSDSVKIASGTNVTVAYTDDNTITISSTDTNTDTLQSVSADTANADRYITFVANATGAQEGLTSTGLIFNPGTSILKVPATFTIDPATHGDNTGTLVIDGNLTVNGTTTTISSTEVNIGDTLIRLNANETGTPTQDAGVEVERGTSDNVAILWDESEDRWTFTNDGTNYYNIPVPSEYNTDTNTTYTVSTEAGSGDYDKKIRLTGSDASTDDVTLAVGQTDGTYGLAIAEVDDTITFSHGDTSTLTGKQGSAGIKSVTVDGMGHITAVETETYLTAESDTLQTVTTRGNTTTDNVQLNGSAVALAPATVAKIFTSALAATVNQNTAQVIDSWAAATYRSAIYQVQITQGSEFQFGEVRILHDGSSVYLTEFAVLENGTIGTAPEPVFAASIAAGTLSLTATISDAATTNAVMIIERKLFAV